MPGPRDLISDFLDRPPDEREEGEYAFELEDEIYLDDIPEEDFVYSVIERPTATSRGLVQISFPDVPVRDVFTTKKASRATYVSRHMKDSSTYEAALLLALNDPGCTVVIHGPTKLGKSTLWQRVIGAQRIVLRCASKHTLDELYGEVLVELNPSYISTVKQSTGEKNTQEDAHGLEAGVPNVLKATKERKKSRTHETTSEETRVFRAPPASASAVSGALAEKSMPLVFENFHRLDPSCIQQLSYDLRTFADQQVTTILVGIPGNPYALIESNAELLGRTIFMPFSFWTSEDLEHIARGGERILRIRFDDAAIHMLATEAAGSPLLMQLYCQIACLASGVTKTCTSETRVAMDAARFKTAMQSYVKLFFSPCEAICARIATAAVESESLPDDFCDTLVAYLKERPPSLQIPVKTSPFASIHPDGFVDLVERLNNDELTRDALLYDEVKGNLTLANPVFLSYSRWIA